MGVEFEYAIQNGVTVRFAEKPSENIRTMLKANGIRWLHGAWYRRRVMGAANFLAALEHACNPGKPDGDCWHCKSPEGFFRPRSAATPVYCDQCFQELRERELREEPWRGRSAPLLGRATPDPVDLAYEDECARVRTGVVRPLFHSYFGHFRGVLP